MRILTGFLIFLVAFYLLICILLYFFQEKVIFFPGKLDKNYHFTFDQPYEEINIKTPDNNSLNGLLFKSKRSKGLVFYLHGNSSSLRSWGYVAKRYTDLDYDVFILDYPGFGKSTGSIRNKEQLFEDIQSAYEEMKKRYSENQITVLGYSIGTGLAAYIASANHPKLLILQAPYYSMKDLMGHKYPILPAFLLKYDFQTNKYLKDCRMPVVIFHGNQDKVIYYGSSIKLKNEMKKSDTLITLNGQDHNGITDNSEYINALKSILN